ncbi:hypothetical protein [Lactobacillus kitasatonis]|nr:hypothetical protein [Lactobacillus kitasatonis]
MIFMLRKNIFPLTSMVLVLGLTRLATQVEPVKASTYGNGAVVTVPKKMQGTWYSYDRDAHDGQKITFGAHTVNGKLIYTQDKNVISDYFNGKIKNQKKFDQVTKNWMSGKTTTMKNDTFYEIDPWVTFEKWSLYRVTPQTINGQKHNILVYTSRYDGGNYYRSKKLAKQMKDYKFEKVNYTM